MAIERIDPNGLDRQLGLMVDIELAAAGGLSEAGPVGRLVSGAAKARLRDESFEQERPVTTIVELPVGGDLPGGCQRRSRSADSWLRSVEEAAGERPKPKRSGSSRSASRPRQGKRGKRIWWRAPPGGVREVCWTTKDRLTLAGYPRREAENPEKATRRKLASSCRY